MQGSQEVFLGVGSKLSTGMRWGEGRHLGCTRKGKGEGGGVAILETSTAKPRVWDFVEHT